MTGAFQIFRPFAWMAAIAFLVGFVSYLALADQPAATLAYEEVQAIPAAIPASGPVSDEWNVEKHI